MIERLRTQIGTAGLIVAIVALVAALGGGAYAATGAGNGKATASAKAKQGKQGKPGKTGAAGPQGPAGPAGAKGDIGAAGSNGSNGTNGTSVTGVAIPTTSAACNHQGGTAYTSASGTENVCNGKNGTTGFTAVLPPGKTETGVWGASVSIQPASKGLRFFPISFTIPLEAAPTAIFVGPAEESKLPDCPGRGAGVLGIPEAAPGKLCIYAGGFEEATFLKVVTPGFKEGEGISQLGAGPTGALININCTGEECQALGSWAVTAAE